MRKKKITRRFLHLGNYPPRICLILWPHCGRACPRPDRGSGRAELLTCDRQGKARVRTCVCPNVCLQVGRFPVNSVASVKSALVSLHWGVRGPHASSPSQLLSGDRGGGRGHGWCGRVGQRGVAALPATRGVAALRVGRHGAELTVQVGEDTGHCNHVGPLQPQRLPHFPVFAGTVGLPGEQAHGGRLAGGDDRGGSV